MRNCVCFAFLFLLASLTVAAQDFPKAEIFGGYQLSRQNSTSLNGWNASLTGNYNRWFGLTGDFSGAYKSGPIDFKSYTFTFGPTVAARNNETFTPFAHALFGGFHQVDEVNGTNLGSVTGFAFIMGGGVDVKITPHIAARVGQFDWMSFHSSDASSNSFRYSGGLVLRF